MFGKQKEISLLQAYRMANDVANNSSDLDEEIVAYQKVVDVGLRQKSISKEDILKTQMIMFWAYNNIGDALQEKKSLKESVEYYNLGLHFARDNLEKISVLNKMAHNFKNLGQDDEWIDAKEKIIENIADDKKRSAYYQLATEVLGDRKAKILEKALSFVSNEEVSALAKCQNTMQISEVLKEEYKKSRNNTDFNRICKLMDKTSILLVKLIEERLENEDEREKRIRLFEKLINVEKKYFNRDNLHLHCIYRRLLEIINDDDTIVVDDEVLNKTKIKEELKKN